MKTIIVTGSNKGIGLGIVEKLAGKAFRIIMACRSVDKAEETRKNIMKSFPGAHIDIMELQVDNSKSIDSFVEKVHKTYGEVDILLNNAGS